MAPNIILLSWVFFGAIDVFLFICVLAWNIGTCWTTSHCPTKKRSQWNLKIYTAVSRFFLRTQKLVECSVVKSKTHGFYMVSTYSVCLLDWTTYRPKFGHCVFTMAGGASVEPTAVLLQNPSYIWPKSSLGMVDLFGGIPSSWMKVGIPNSLGFTPVSRV